MDFSIALNSVLHLEGRYSNDKDDIGAETYCGISRKFHPNWNGWIIIDEYKTDKDFLSIVNSDRVFDKLYSFVYIFYKQYYWDVFHGDEIESYKIASKLFDIAVNLGVVNAIKFLQTGLNILNRNQILYDDLVIDGLFGEKTFLCLTILLNYSKVKNNGDDYALFKILTILQGNYYIESCLKREIHEKYIRGWLKRVNL
jgi:lysozyme family protein